MKKVLGGFLGVLVGYSAGTIVKYAILLSGPFVLGPMGISGPRAARDLESIAEIVGFVMFILVLLKIYRFYSKRK